MSKVTNQKFSRNITAKVGRPSYLNLKFLTKGLTDLLRCKTKRNLRPTQLKADYNNKVSKIPVSHIYSVKPR